MLSSVTILVSLTLVALAVVQLPFVFGLVRCLRQPQPARLDDSQCPQTAVILCLRGSDPFLTDCIEALLDQDYPRYDVYIVVDHTEDPAGAVVQGVIQRRQAQNVTLRVREQLHETCSLVNSSVVQTIQSLDSSYEVLAILDADVIAHRTWLRELVEPLASDPTIAACAGNRWYLPSHPNLGALVRYIWNAGAVVQMYWNHYTWGGSLAMRMQLLRESDLLDRWLHAFAFDTTVSEEAHRQGWRTQFVPSIIMTNRETCSLSGFYPWLKRQLLLSRLYHPRWPMVLGQGVLTSAAILLGLVVAVVAVFSQQWTVMAWATGGLLFYLATMIGILALLEWSMRKVIAARGESTGWLSASVLVKMLIALPLAQLLFCAGLVGAAYMRQVHWRRIDYRIDSPYQVRMLGYRPYEAEGGEACATGSLTSL